ncbi:MAG: DUF6538 domain-containing protein [Novosphingobium sp.]
MRGLWLRGSTYQFRVRVPVDLRVMMGCSHVNRSLRTDSRSLAIRLSRRVAFEIDVEFEKLRREAGMDFDDRLLTSEIDGPTVRVTIPERSPPESATVTVARDSVPCGDASSAKTLADIYDRYLKDPTKRRGRRTARS